MHTRLGRLLYAVTHNPGLLSVGVDEDTADLIENDLLRVTGGGTVTVVDGSEMKGHHIASLSGSLPLAVSGIRLHNLSQDCTFDLRQHCAEINLKYFPLSGRWDKGLRAGFSERTALCPLQG